MDKLTRYRELVKGLLTELAAPVARYPDGDVESACVFDDQRGHYLVLSVGWTGDRRVRGTPIHVRLRDGKVWVEEDWTDARVVDRLVEAGIPKEDIVLGFQPPNLRKLTEFAVA